MFHVWDTKQHQLFHQQLFSAAQNLIPNNPVSESDASVRQLATLTKLVVRRQETVRSLSVSCPMIITVLAGTKIVYIDGQTMTFSAGDLFILPSDFTFDVINQPACTGEYIALVLELSANLLNRVRQAYPEIITSLSNNITTENFSGFDLRITLSLSLADTLIHLVKGIVYNTNQKLMLNEHHLVEIVLLLLQSNVRMLMLQAIYPDFSLLARSLIRNDLSSEWSLKRLAQALNISASTLKRRLQEANLSFRQLLDEERMSKAMDLLTQPHQSIAEIAAICGYESQSRFAARFRKYYSLNPSDVRSCHTNFPSSG
ncbi:MAG: AraC family transcriptional regulator [Leptolyngbyaceae cyanobacterium RM2_2_4]|nr:AraC family transcriptional regulator [Leptolyngbyaceae cyanobacterium SM1_4_3]NJN92520.1 AraC family transcriptional regulator [Leptolyngbyaceae cyanobacterium SL_5_14]NJO53152.1 AraC family transcriptional regulator [Leptolyngbyaceae cyanobacterium RM2_2_4]